MLHDPCTLSLIQALRVIYITCFKCEHKTVKHLRTWYPQGKSSIRYMLVIRSLFEYIKNVVVASHLVHMYSLYSKWISYVFFTLIFACQSIYTCLWVFVFSSPPLFWPVRWSLLNSTLYARFSILELSITLAGVCNEFCIPL